jgi:hypothetical protein
MRRCLAFSAYFIDSVLGSHNAAFDKGVLERIRFKATGGLLEGDEGDGKSHIEDVDESAWVPEDPLECQKHCNL